MLFQRLVGLIAFLILGVSPCFVLGWGSIRTGIWGRKRSKRLECKIEKNNDRGAVATKEWSSKTGSASTNSKQTASYSSSYSKKTTESLFKSKTATNSNPKNSSPSPTRKSGGTKPTFKSNSTPKTGPSTSSKQIAGKPTFKSTTGSSTFKPTEKTAQNSNHLSHYSGQGTRVSYVNSYRKAENVRYNKQEKKKNHSKQYTNKVHQTQAMKNAAAQAQKKNSKAGAFVMELEGGGMTANPTRSFANHVAGRGVTVAQETR